MFFLPHVGCEEACIQLLCQLALSKIILSFSKDPHQTMVMQHAAMEWVH